MRVRIERLKREDIRSIIRYVYLHVRLIARRLRYNYYLKKWVECRRNEKLLKQARSSCKEDSSNKNPLISVHIATYNRGKVLKERTIPSILRQTYKNFEIVIVGDHSTDNTEELLKKFNDERIKFYNLSKRGDYPTNPIDRWMVAGVVPRNKAIELCTGDWIAPLDDDDEFSEDHLEVLLGYAVEHAYEMAYSVTEMEIEPGEWRNVGSYRLKCGMVCYPSVLYHSKLKFFKFDINAWKYGEPDDWNMWRRMKEAGVKIGFVNRVLSRHYLEATQNGIWNDLQIRSRRHG